ncbi:MAG: hypothetical protein AAFU77_09160 [Myxococcota bacterium]
MKAVVGKQTVRHEGVVEVTIHDGSDTMNFGEVVSRMIHQETFRYEFIRILSESPFAAYFWESPPVTRHTTSKDFRFVFVESKHLSELVQDPLPFREHLRANSPCVSFWNLGQNARLVAPTLVQSDANYAHLAAFVSSAPRRQQSAFWKMVGREIDQTLSDSPTWISTAGLGVAWLHLRLDARPKYYRHRPYTRTE